MTYFWIIAVLIAPSGASEELMPREFLRAASLAECELVHAPRVASARAKLYAEKVRASRGRVEARCVEAKQ